MKSRDCEPMPKSTTSRESSPNALAKPGQAGQEKLSRKKKLIYGVGEVNASGTTIIVGFFFNYFLLNVACVEPNNVAIIMLVSKIFDGVNDQIIGYLSDRTESRWGRRKPWILFGCLPYALCYTLLWYVPTGPESQLWLTVYFTIMNCLFDTALTAITLPYHTMTTELTDDYNERTSLNAWRFSFAMQVNIVGILLQGIFVGLFGGSLSSCTLADGEPATPTPSGGWTDQACAAVEGAAFTAGTTVYAPQKGYLLSGLIIAISIVIIPSLIFVFCIGEEKHKDRAVTDGPGCWDGLLVVLKNRAFVMVVLIYLLGWLSIQFIQNNLAFYMRYHILAPGSFSLIIMVLMEACFFSLIGWNIFTAKYGKKCTWYVGTLILALSLVGMYCTPRGGLTLTYILCGTGGVGLGVLYLIPWSMLPDVVDVDEIETGKRREGIYYGWIAFFQKLALGVAMAGSNAVLGAMGYVNPVAQCGGATDAVDEQPEAAINALILLNSLVPACLLALSWIPTYFYPITEEVHRENSKKIKELHGDIVELSGVGLKAEGGTAEASEATEKSKDD